MMQWEWKGRERVYYEIVPKRAVIRIAAAMMGTMVRKKIDEDVAEDRLPGKMSLAR